MPQLWCQKYYASEHYGWWRKLETSTPDIAAGGAIYMEYAHFNAALCFLITLLNVFFISSSVSTWNWLGFSLLRSLCSIAQTGRSSTRNQSGMLLWEEFINRRIDELVSFLLFLLIWSWQIWPGSQIVSNHKSCT